MSLNPLVRFERVDVDIAGTPVLRDVDWELRAGEHWGIVGANGSGKTTFLGLIAGALWPVPGRGRRIYDFGDGALHDAVAARQRIVLVGHELQDRYARWNWNFTGLDVVLSGVYRTDVPRRRPAFAERNRALGLMRRLEIADLAERAFLELSRGQQRRILIARGIAFEPTVLLLDEPASGLDRKARAELARMLARIAEHATLVCSAHAASDLPSVIERVLRLEHGRIAAVDRRGVGRTGAVPAVAPEQSDGSAPSPHSGSGTLIAIDRANVWLGNRHVLRDISWRLERGQQWLVTGGNGAGKTTFLRLLHGQTRPALGGEIRWPGFGDTRDVWELRRAIAWVSPELQAAYRYPTTVRACIASGFASSVGLTRAPTPAEAARVEHLLRQFELVDLADRKLATLSYGQVRRALLARALAPEPLVLLLDEPWEGLDAAMAALLNEQLDAIVAEGTQLVCASHLDMRHAGFTHELVLDNGRISESRDLRAARQ